MVVAVTPSPSPTTTLAPSLVSAYGLANLQPRQTNIFDYDAGCLNVNAGLQCTSILNGCYDNLLQATNYEQIYTSCFCNYGIPYLDCFYSKVATGTCASYYFGTGSTIDYGDYQRDYFLSYCGTIPPSAMAKIQAPTSVSLSLETVKVVTATTALQQPNYNAQPNYKGSGDLLKGPCSSTGFTLVDASSTVYYAGFVGCNKVRPECCPWAVASTGTTPAPGASTGAAGPSPQDNVEYNFPKPANNDLAQLASCADDYYSISGGCCPNGFWPFTSEVGGITPCWSSVKRIPPPTLTVEKDAKTLDKPTSAVVNIVWSMRYPVADPGGGGLSTAAKAGIGAGAGVAVIIIAALAFCLWRSKRKNKKAAETQPPAAPGQALPKQQLQQPPFQQQQPPFQQPQMMQHAPVPGGQYPPGAFAAGMAAPGMMPPQSDRASIMTSTTQLSPAALIPQNTGTSNGAVSELSSQSGQGLLHNGQPGGYFAGGAAAAANPRVSYPSSSGTASPAVGGNGQVYPAPIAEADEGQQHYPQYGYQQQQQFPQQQQQQQQPYYAPPGQGQYYQAPPQGTPPPGGYAYPQPQQQPYPQNMPEMGTGREVDPPQEVTGSHVHHGPRE